MDHINFYVRGNGGVTVACVDCQWFVRMEDAEVDLEEINRLTQGHHDAENTPPFALAAALTFTLQKPFDKNDPSEVLRWKCSACDKEFTTTGGIDLAHAKFDHGATQVMYNTMELAH